MPAVAAPPRSDHLTERSALELAAAIRERKLTAREVVDAHIALIEERNAAVNALVATRFDAARAEADEADRLLGSRRGRKDPPPLLGVPCTIKESFAVAGMPHTSGSVARRELVAERSATAVERLVAAGAIPLGVTNTSELTLWIESDNRVWGRTNSAYDPGRTAGGSSGGEGAAIGSGFAPFGLGTDIGGSIRLPAFFNGVFGHKPSGALVPHTGHYPFPNDRGSFLLGSGPLARRAEDLMPLLRTIAGPDGIDSDGPRRRARRPRRGLDRGAAGGALRRRDPAAGLARAPQRPHPCRAGAARGRRRGRPGLAAVGADGDPAIPERDARVRWPARAAHRGRRRDPRLRPPGRRRGPRAQPVHLRPA